MTTETTTEVPTVAQPVAPAAVRESVMGAKLTVAWTVGLVIAACGGTYAIMDTIDKRMDEKMKGVREDMERFRSDVKEGFRDLKDEVRMLRDGKK